MATRRSCSATHGKAPWYVFSLKSTQSPDLASICRSARWWFVASVTPFGGGKFCLCCERVLASLEYVVFVAVSVRRDSWGAYGAGDNGEASVAGILISEQIRAHNHAATDHPRQNSARLLHVRSSGVLLYAVIRC
jgi:hypothetical protein